MGAGVFDMRYICGYSSDFKEYKGGGHRNEICTV